MTLRQSGHRYATDNCYNNSKACARYLISSDAKGTYLLNAGAAFSVCPPVAPRPESPLRVLSYPSTLEEGKMSFVTTAALFTQARRLPCHMQLVHLRWRISLPSWPTSMSGRHLRLFNG